jgi:sirohydrochlorin ferrochelatase
VTAGRAGASAPVLLAVAHGSRDSAAQDSVRALADRVRRLSPALDVRVAFVQNAEPSLAEALATAGNQAVVVPLLLSTGYHLTADIRGAAAVAGAPVADPLGPDQRLAEALADRLAETGRPVGTPTVLAAAGSAEPAAAADVARQAALLADRIAEPVVPAFAAAGQPSVTRAVAALHASTGRPVSVATYLLSPGQFHDRLRQAAATWVSAPLGDHPAVARLVLDRFTAARAAAGI